MRNPVLAKYVISNRRPTTIHLPHRYLRSGLTRSSQASRTRHLDLGWFTRPSDVLTPGTSSNRKRHAIVLFPMSHLERPPTRQRCVMVLGFGAAIRVKAFVDHDHPCSRPCTCLIQRLDPVFYQGLLALICVHRWPPIQVPVILPR
jgi:hypothetical protein